MENAPLETRILDQLRTLRTGTTMCPGRLSVNLGSRLAQVRPTLEAMARAGRIVILQKGRVADPDRLKGPFRVAPPPNP